MTAMLSSEKPTVGRLAGQIANTAHILEQSLGIDGLPSGDQIAIKADASADERVRKARLEIIDQCTTLLNVVAGPSEMLKNMVLIDKHNLVTLQIINHYRIAEMIPAEDQLSLHDLAQASKLPPDILVRVLRQAMTYNVFYEPKLGFIAHTEASKLIPSLSPLLSYQLEICLPSTIKLLESLKESQEHDPKQSRSPFQIAHSTSDTWWSYAEKSPTWTQIYGRYMALITSGGAHDVCHVINGYDWAELGCATLVDIGGADGFVATTIAKEFPSLHVIIQDSANLEVPANKAIPVELQARVQFTPHSFFEPQLASTTNADVYLLRHILHDWPERECLHILSLLSGTMKKGARILVAEQILAPVGTLPNHTEKIIHALDMQMMVQFGSKERTLEDWTALFELVNPPLRIVGMKTPAGSADTLMELKLA